MSTAREQAREAADAASDIWEPLLKEALELAWDFAEQAYRSNAEIPALHRQTLARLKEALG